MLYPFLFGVSGSVGLRSVVSFNIVCGAILHALWCALRMLGGSARERLRQRATPYAITRARLLIVL
jgi:hypothetical protein